MTVELAISDLGGSGPPLVLGPSLGTSAHNLWGAAAPLLADRFHVLAWDLPGHGRGEPATGFTVRDLATAVLARTDGPFHYAGVSLGGAVGLQLLLDAPDRLASATLLCTGARIGEPAGWLERAARVRAGGTGFLLDAAPERWFAPANRDTPAARALLRDLAGADPESYAAACDALAAFDLRPRLAEIERPVLAVAGALDPVTPAGCLRHVADGVRHGRLAILDGVAHQAPAEAPAAVAALMASAPPADTTTTAQLRAEGMRVRREVLGDPHVDRASADADAFTAEFQEFITRYAWGAIWTRPGLDRRSRSMITLTALVARGQHDELAMHVRAALTNGLTKDEIKEVLLQAAVYCGVPAANAAFRIARQVFAELESTT